MIYTHLFLKKSLYKWLLKRLNLFHWKWSWKIYLSSYFFKIIISLYIYIYPFWAKLSIKQTKQILIRKHNITHIATISFCGFASFYSNFFWQSQLPSKAAYFLRPFYGFGQLHFTVLIGFTSQFCLASLQGVVIFPWFIF